MPRRLKVASQSGFFKSSADALRRVFNKTKSMTHPRFHRNMKFENVIEQYRKDGVFQRMQSFGNGEIESLTIPHSGSNRPRS